MSNKIFLSYDKMRQLARYEITFENLIGEDNVLEDIEFVCSDTYIYTGEDIYKSIRNIWKKDPYVKEFQTNWLSFMTELSKEFNLDSIEKIEWKAPVFQQFLMDSTNLEITDEALLNLFWNLFIFDDNSLHISQVLKDKDPLEGFKRLLALKKKPVPRWSFTDSEMFEYLLLFREENVAEQAEPNKKRLAETFIDHLLEKEDELFIDIKDADYHILMGDLYCHGHKKHVRDYQKAFQYYSNAAVSNHPEGMYKLADLLDQGKGCTQNKDMAKMLYKNSYQIALKAFLNNEKSCLASVAWRMGNMCLDDTKLEAVKAYEYYLQAQCAVKTFPKESDFFGNIPIHYQIAAALDRSREYFKEDKIYQKAVKTPFPNYFLKLCEDNYPCALSISIDEDDNFKLTAGRLATQSVKKPQAVMITIPEGSFCQRSHAISYFASDTMQLWTKDDVMYFKYDFCDWDAPRNRFRFYLNNELIASIHSDEYTFICEKQEMEYWIASASFDGDQRAYDYICPFDVVAGDKVIVENFEGEAIVTIVDLNLKKESELSFPVEKYRIIKRIA